MRKTKRISRIIAMKVKRSEYFIPFKKDVKISEIAGCSNKEQSNSTNAIVRMLKGGFIHQQASGIYTWLNLGLRMLEKVIKIIDEEHEKVGAIKILMPTLHPAKLWKESNRYQEYGSEMLKIFDRHEREFVYGPSAEEMFTEILTQWPLNKNSFPMTLYNIQWKFRDEIRPRFAIVRSREFLMKDAYSFHKNMDCLMNTYQIMFNVYSNIFSRLKLNVCTFSSDVGIMGGHLSHEFLVKSNFGETLINYEKWPSQPIKWEERDNATLDETEFDEATSQNREKYAEIGHIYALGNKYTKPFKLHNLETKEPLEMGCYGIGVSRLIGVIFENNIHDLGVLAPFKYTIVTMQNDDRCNELAQKIMDFVDEAIWDDRDISCGVKFAEADLIGSPLQIRIGLKELEKNEVQIKQNGEVRTVDVAEMFAIISEISA